MKVTLSLVADVVFSAFICFILSFVILNFYIQRIWAIILSIIISGILSFFVYKTLSRKNVKTKLKKAETKVRNNVYAQLGLSTENEQCAIFETALKKDGYSIEKKRGGLFIKNKNSVIFPKFGFDQVSKADIVRIFNSIKKDDVAYVLSESFSSETKDFADRFGGRIKLVFGDAVYLYLKEKDVLPETKFSFPEKKPLNLSAFKNIFQKKKAKTLLWFGLIFLFSSYFVPIKTYYVICGSIFLVLALITRIYGKETPLQVN